MSLHPIILQTDKTITDFTKDFETVKQSEKGQVLQGTILNADKEPYDLSASGIYLVYCEQKSEGKMIIDKGNGKDPADDAGVMTITDAKNGKFTYKLCQQAYAATGDAWIEIYNGTNFVDSTESFRMIVEPAASIHYSNDNYISDMANILTSLKAEFTRAKATVDALEKDVSDTNSDVGQKLTALQNKVQGFQDQYAQIQSNYDTAMKKITDQATTDTQNAVNAINGKYTADMKTLQDQFNSWEKTTTDNYTKQINDLIAQAKQNGVDVDKLSGEISNLQKSLGNIDLTQFIKPADLTSALANYYTKTEVNEQLKNAGSVKTVRKTAPDSSGDVEFPIIKEFDSPQAAYDASKGPDGDKYICVYDMDDGSTSAVINGKAVTISTLNDAVNALQTQVGSLSGTLSSKADSSSLANLQNQITANAIELKSKADASALQTLANSINAKANASDLGAYAKKSDVAGLVIHRASSEADADNFRRANPNFPVIVW